jgi:hypothetical protein
MSITLFGNRFDDRARPQRSATARSVAAIARACISRAWGLDGTIESKAWYGASHAVQFGGNARRVKAVGVLDAFVYQRIELAHDHVRRRQSRQVLSQ